VSRVGAKKAQILVLGAGFGGLTFCKKFRHPDASVTVVDRTNHHLFQPLLYQVATAGLSAPDIAQPVRAILRDVPNLTVVLDEARDFDLANRRVIMEHDTRTYDYLVLALGGVTSYFGHPEWEEFAPGLKTLEDALRIRTDVLLAFEQAENEHDPKVRDALMTIVIVGGGPTGVELAGACAELARHVLRRDFDHIDPGQAKVILIEGSPVILSHMPPDLAESAQKQLERLGVEVRTSSRVKSIAEGRVDLEGGGAIFAKNILWAAGVSATPLTRRLGVELDRAGRVKVNPDLSLPGHPNVFAVGDMALVMQEDGKPVPGVSPAAMQMARHVSEIIEDELSLGVGRAHRPAFKYWDKGTMATIGRSAAVAYSGPIKMKGFIAWLAWLFVHLVFLIGLRNKVMVFMQWVYSYLTYKRGARIITGWPPKLREVGTAPSSVAQEAATSKSH
jgi:NADH:ubiquinone reductase (H+-translocating)